MWASIVGGAKSSEGIGLHKEGDVNVFRVWWEIITVREVGGGRERRDGRDTVGGSVGS